MNERHTRQQQFDDPGIVHCRPASLGQEPPRRRTGVRPERAVALVEDLPFDSIYGAWWGRNVRGGAKEALARSAERYLARVDRGASP